MKNKLINHLSSLSRNNKITAWEGQKILPGEDWHNEIANRLQFYDIFLLLISSNYLASEYCISIEAKIAMERHSKGLAKVVPVIVKTCDWSGYSFSKLKALPKNAKPIDSWKNKEVAFTNVAKSINRLISYMY